MGQAQGTDGRLLAGRYRLGDVLGKGGMGTVWRAVDETLGRTVAVKELRFPHDIDEEEKRRLITRTLREAKATARIRSTGAVTVYDVVEEDDRPWIVMELVEGRSLSDAIREDGPLTPKRAAEVGLTVLDVLRAAHGEGILHRDVKPSNVLLGEDGRIVLSDFGIAQIDGDPSVTSTGMLVGAPSYISPERARGRRPGPPADLWSLGALLYASVEGRPPYDKGSAIATLTAVMTEPLTPPWNAGPLADAICGLLAKDPEQRLDDAGVRGMLTKVANAPDTPAAAPLPEQTRTLPVPADPQPTPTDAPPAARKAAADQAKVRSALRSVRGAQAPGPKAAAPARPGAAPAGPVLNRGLVAVIVIVLLAIAGTTAAVVMANADDPDSGSTGRKNTASSAPAEGSVGEAEDKPTSTSSPVSPASRPPSPAGTGGGGVPAGFETVSNQRFRHSIALPQGWEKRGIAGDNSGQRYWGSRSYPRVQVDFTGEPGSDAAAAWRSADEGMRLSGYRKISIEEVEYNGYRTAADWEFTYTSGGTTYRVLNRGFVVDDTHGYAIMFTAAADEWDSAENRELRRTFFETFKPAD